MMDQFERLNDLVEALVAQRRSKRLRLSSADELEALQMAAALNASQPNADDPSPEFVAALHLRLLEEQAAPALRRTFGLVSRRNLFGSMAASVIASLLAGIGLDRWVLPKPAEPPRQRRWPAPLVGDDGQWVPVGMASTMPPGTVQRFTAGAIGGHILNEDGQFRAVSASCTCMGCILTWNAEGDEFVCPCHGATFDRAGAMVDESPLYPGVQLRRLPQIRVQVEEDAVMVWTTGPIEQPPPPPLPPLV